MHLQIHLMVPHIANLMKSKGYVSTLNEAFQKYLGNGKVGDSRIHQNQITDVIQVAKESKSLIFLAHPHTLVSNKNYSFSKNWHDQSFFEILENDSLSYINNESIRSALYPSLIDFFETNYNYVIIFQVIFLALSIVFLVQVLSEFVFNKFLRLFFFLIIS